MFRRYWPLSPVLASCFGILPAQQVRIDRLEPLRAAAPSGSVEWFRATAELVEAQLVVDCGLAAATAAAAYEVARRSGVIGAAETMAAMAELATSRLEGPQRTYTWRARATDLPPDTDLALTAHFHLARARSICAAGDHVAELHHSIPGQTAAERTDDALLGLRAAQITLHVTPRRSLHSLRQRYEQIAQGAQADAAQSFEPWLLIDEALSNQAAEPSQQMRERLARAAELARQQGNRLALANALSLTGNTYARTEPAEATVWYERAAEVLRPVGNRSELALLLDIWAWTLGRLGDFPRAYALVEEAEQLIADRGLHGPEAALIDTRIELATRSGDGPEAARLVARRDELARTAVANDEDALEARAQLRRAEVEAARVEEELRASADRARELTAHYRLLAIGITCASLLVLVLLSWRSRRRLREANRRLAEQVERVEAARRDQAVLEERLRSLERVQGLGTMAAGVAHDFNNLLTGIIANAELIEEAGTKSDPGELAQGIRKAGRRAANLCKQLQIFAGGAPIASTEVDLAAALRSLLPVLRAACGTAVTVEVDVVDEPLPVRADPTGLDQAVLNLVLNARDAKATRITIRAAVLVAGERFVVEVADDGEGMPADVAERIFDPFFTTRFPGRGLGLAVVSGIVHRHGGVIRVESEVGKGSTFRIELPSAACSERAPAEPVVTLPRAPSSREGVLALVIDDDEHVRDVTLHMLRFLGCEAKGFEDPDPLLSAVTRAPAERRLLGFVDLTMPGVEGTEVLRRGGGARADARVVLMSGHTDAYVHQVAADAEPDRVLHKPFQLDVLRLLLDELLQGSLPTPSSRG